MNTVLKGWKKERECRVLLEKQGYKIIFKSIRWKWGTLDLAGLFDTLAVRKVIKNQEPVVEWLFVSNKYDTSYSKAHYTAIQAFIRDFGIEEGLYHIYVWHKPKWAGRGAKKHWQKSQWKIIEVKPEGD